MFTDGPLSSLHSGHGQGCRTAQIAGSSVFLQLTRHWRTAPIAMHAYHCVGGLEERDAKRGEMGKNSEWKIYLSECRKYMKFQCSNIFVEAPLVNTMVEGVTGLANVGTGAGDDCILEICRYKLVLGYNTVPRFLSLYGAGLASKLNAQGTRPRC
jgi:hypothetical protein